jgi:type I site-specific restriction-modification system R (restriction) subunit
MADEGIIDVSTAAGLKKPDISILSDQFLSEVRGLKYKNVAAELLAKLLKDEIKTRSARNVVQGRQFREMLKSTLNAYHNRAISTMEVIEELIKLTKELDAATKRGQDLGLTIRQREENFQRQARPRTVRSLPETGEHCILAESYAEARCRTDSGFGFWPVAAGLPSQVIHRVLTGRPKWRFQ